MKDLGIIYCWTNKLNNKKYIGQTVNPKRRYKEHLSSKNNSLLDRAIQKYGESNFEYTVLEECPKSELDEREIYYISLYNTNKYKGGYGYNCTDGGLSGAAVPKSENGRKNISDSIWNRGKHWSSEKKILLEKKQNLLCKILPLEQLA